MGCCASVKQALTSLPGVTNVETDAGTTTAVVSVDPAKFDAAAAVAALEKAHYPATIAEDVSPGAARPEETVEAPAEAETTEAAEKPEGEEPETETPEEAATEKPEATEEATESTEKPAEAKEETEVIE